MTKHFSFFAETPELSDKLNSVYQDLFFAFYIRFAYFFYFFLLHFAFLRRATKVLSSHHYP